MFIYKYTQTCATIVTEERDHEFEKEKGETYKVLKKGELEEYYNFKNRKLKLCIALEKNLFSIKRI